MEISSQRYAMDTVIVTSDYLKMKFTTLLPIHTSNFTVMTKSKAMDLEYIFVKVTYVSVKWHNPCDHLNDRKLKSIYVMKFSYFYNA